MMIVLTPNNLFSYHGSTYPPKEYSRYTTNKSGFPGLFFYRGVAVGMRISISSTRSFGDQKQKKCKSNAAKQPLNERIKKQMKKKMAMTIGLTFLTVMMSACSQPVHEDKQANPITIIEEQEVPVRAEYLAAGKDTRCVPKTCAITRKDDDNITISYKSEAFSVMDETGKIVYTRKTGYKAVDEKGRVAKEIKGEYKKDKEKVVSDIAFFKDGHGYHVDIEGVLTLKKGTYTIISKDDDASYNFGSDTKLVKESTLQKA